MTLAQLSAQYEASAALIAQRLTQLRLAQRLRRRITELRPMLAQCRCLAQVTARYYDRDFYGYDEYRI